MAKLQLSKISDEPGGTKKQVLFVFTLSSIFFISVKQK